VRGPSHSLGEKLIFGRVGAVCYIASMNDDIIQQRIVGRSVRAIAKAQGRSVALVN
jgi:hypothetical protein